METAPLLGQRQGQGGPRWKQYGGSSGTARTVRGQPCADKARSGEAGARAAKRRTACRAALLTAGEGRTRPECRRGEACEQNVACAGTVSQPQKEGHHAATGSLENTAVTGINEPQKVTRRESTLHRPGGEQVASRGGVRRSLGEESSPEPASQKPKKVTSHKNERAKSMTLPPKKTRYCRQMCSPGERDLPFQAGAEMEK